MLGLSDIASFTTRSPATIRSMIIVLSDIIKEELVKEIKESKGYACLIDKVTDISNVQNLLIFIRFYDMEKGMTVSKFVNTCDILGESETMSADALSIFLCLKNVLENNLGLNLEELIGFCLDGASVMTGKDNGVVARFKQIEECCGMLSVHCICHPLALACGDTGDDLKFTSDFKTTMIQLWMFFKNSQKHLNTFIKTAKNLKISFGHNRDLLCRR